MGHFGQEGHLHRMTDIAVQDATNREAIALEATVRLAARGDERAFDRLVSEHHAAMSRVAYVICGDADVTRDAVQGAWSIAWRRLPSLRDPVQIRAWLVAIAANEARQALRRQRRRPVVDLSATYDHTAGGDPADAIEVVDLQRALSHLRPDERQLLAL